MTSAALAQIDGVSKRFGRQAKPAIADLSTRIQPGTVTGLVGPDGAGKTTLLRLIAGLLLPDTGAITFPLLGGEGSHGLLNTRDHLSKLRELLSYMPQRFGLYEDLTVIENLNLYADLRNVIGQERSDAFNRLLKFTGLANFTDRLAGKLSGGMKQKLGLACSLIRAPRLLLLDEPSVGVDPISRRELWRMVYELVDQGIGVVWSTAYLDEAERCGVVLLLNEGQLIYDGPPKDLTNRLVGRSFLVRKLSVRKRQLLAQALRRADVVDGVIQGRSVRLVLSPDAPAPASSALGDPHAVIEETTPRFEDAFIDLVGQTFLPAAATPPPSSVASGVQRPYDSPSADKNVCPTVIEANDLTRRFGDFTAANHITFQVRRGEIFGLLGPNGAGKSTTFKMMCGLLRPTSGTAHVTGLDLYHTRGAARARLGYMAQKFSLYSDLSVRQNLDFFAGIYGLTNSRKRDSVRRMIETFALQTYLASAAGELPLGFKQRLALACAIMHVPAVLFLDEPTSGVDPLTRREFWSHINAMVENGVTIMVTTHFLDEAEYCDRIGLIYRGNMIAEGSPDDLKDSVRGSRFSEPSLEDAFIALVEDYDAKEAA